MPTVYMSSVASDLGGGSDFSNKLRLDTASAVTNIYTIPGNTTEDDYCFSEPLTPNNTAWQTGDWVMKVRHGATDVGVMQQSIRIDHIDSSGTVQESTSFSTEQLMVGATIQTHTFTAVAWAGPFALGDRYRITYRKRNTDSALHSMRYTFNTTGSQSTIPVLTEVQCTGAAEAGCAAVAAMASKATVAGSGFAGGRGVGALAGRSAVAGTASAGASAAAAMASRSALAGAARAGAVGVGGLTGSSAMAGNASAGASGVAAMSSRSSLSGSISASAAGVAAMSSKAAMAGAARAGAAAAGAVSGLVSMVGHADAGSSANGALSPLSVLAGAGAAGASGAASLSSRSALGGSGSAGAGASGALRGTVSLTGSASAGGSGAALLTTLAQLIGAAYAGAVGRGEIASKSNLTGFGSAGARGAGALTGKAALTGSAFAGAAGSAEATAIEAAVVGCLERILQAVRTRYHVNVEVALSIPTLHDNEPTGQDMEGFDAWVRFTVQAQRTDQIVLGNPAGHRYLGTAVATIFLRHGIGDGDAWDLADQINQTFRGETADEVVYFPPPFPTVRARSGDRWVLDVTVPFYAACEEEALV